MMTRIARDFTMPILEPPADGNTGIPVSMSQDKIFVLSLVFPILYVAVGMAALYLRLWNPRDWPLFLKRAVYGSEEYDTWPMGGRRSTNERDRPGRRSEQRDSGAWLEMHGLDRAARSRTNSRDETATLATTKSMMITTPKSVFLYDPTSPSSRDEGLPDEEEAPTPPANINGRRERPVRKRSQQDGTRATTGPRPPTTNIRHQMMRGAIFLVGLTGICLLLFWPLFVVWGIIWWTVYGFWYWDFVHLSTRKARELGRAHSPDSRNSKATQSPEEDCSPRTPETPVIDYAPTKEVILVTHETTIITEDVIIGHVNGSGGVGLGLCLDLEAARAVAAPDPAAVTAATAKSLNGTIVNGNVRRSIAPPVSPPWQGGQNSDIWDAAYFDRREVSTNTGHTATVTCPRRERRTEPIAELNSFYPSPGMLSQKVKAALEYESAWPTPKWCRNAILRAEIRRRHLLARTGGTDNLYTLPPLPPPPPPSSSQHHHYHHHHNGTGGTDSNGRHESSRGSRRTSSASSMPWSDGGHGGSKDGRDNGEVKLARPCRIIPTRRSSAAVLQRQLHHHHRQRHNRNTVAPASSGSQRTTSKLEPRDEDFELRALIPRDGKPRISETPETNQEEFHMLPIAQIPLRVSSVPFSRRRHLDVPLRPPTPDRKSSVRDARGLFTVQEGESEGVDEYETDKKVEFSC